VIPGIFFGLLLVGACLIRLYQGETSWWWVVLFGVLVAYVMGGTLVWYVLTD
jgi:hypothetical protein